MSDSSSGSDMMEKDSEFYLQNAIFLVEGTLFKVPILNFTSESEVFKAMFELPQDPKAIPDGSADTHPLRLDDVKRNDFKQLLRVMYSPSFVTQEMNLTESEWTSVLVLASRWEMERLRTLAIDKLTPTFVKDAHKLVVMGRRYDVDSWLTSGIHLLVVRKDPMNEDDAGVIGAVASLKVAALREWTLQWKIAHRDSTEWILNRRDMPPMREMMRRIRDAFDLREPE